VRIENEPEASSKPVASAPNRPLITVIVPVYNGGEEIVENVAVIRSAVTNELDAEEVEVIVVSDGSIDGTDEMLLAARSELGVRVIHYDRNLGKGYAVKLGALASTGQWVAIVDADLDLHPSSIPSYLDAAVRNDLDFAIGSKRHPDSVVHYPPSRRIASWWYQQLNRLLFRLDVRDTQVGLKVFRGEIADEVVPLLLVKQFAFDLELLAVANALGYGRVRELPVRLDYRFTGSAVRSRAVARALMDTFAIFYRLRILRTYQRKRALVQSPRRLTGNAPLVTAIMDPGMAESLDYPALEISPLADPVQAARAARGELLAVLADGARPAGNWVTAAVPFFTDRTVGAVVAPTVVPTDVPLRESVAAAVLESRLGGGSRRSRYLPGNVRTVVDQSAGSVVVRRAAYLEALEADIGPERLIAWLEDRGLKTVYTPDTSTSHSPPPILGPHLRRAFAQARVRGAVARATRGSSMSLATALSLAPLTLALVAIVGVLAGGAWRTGGFVILVAFTAVLASTASLAALRFRSLLVGLLVPGVVVMTQVAYVAGFASGVVGGADVRDTVTTNSASRHNFET
jgi:glycosyltransferase involved in cell wall biosynthesis